MDKEALRAALWGFLGPLSPAYVLADYPNDVRLLRSALAGGSSEMDLPSSVFTTVLDKEGSTAKWIEAWFATRPALAARRHQAMVDAQALRMAWRVATGRISTEDWKCAEDWIKRPSVIDWRGCQKSLRF